MIPLHRPWFDQAEEEAVLRVLRSGNLAGNGRECAALEAELRRLFSLDYPLAVCSATHALEMIMHLLPVIGGEVIVPSFTFPSAANAVLAAGGAVRFCEVREPDLNVDLDHARSLVGPATRALVVTHYAGSPQRCDDFPVPVIEDAAHALGSRIGNTPCGALGAFGCLSFHHTKNIAGGEGGALLLSDADVARAARIYREKGTNRDDFVSGRVSFYTWMARGSSVVMPEMSAAVARVQLGKLDQILRARRQIASLYDQGLAELERQSKIRVVRPVGQQCVSSHHIYAVLVDPARRERMDDRW